MAEQGRKRNLAHLLLQWYDANARVLPWRVKGQEPYKVWLSEIMLQQTTVAAVKDYYIKFIAAWPTVEALAAAPLDDVLDRKSTRLNSSHLRLSRMPSSA